MSKPNNSQPAGGDNKKPANNPKPAAVATLPGLCMAEECKKKSEKASFCMEHFDWFKEGLITRDGKKPTDFEKKHFDYMRRKNKKKVA